MERAAGATEMYKVYRDLCVGRLHMVKVVWMLAKKMDECIQLGKLR